MSKTIRKAYSYLDLMLDNSTPSKQSKYLIQTATENQVNALCEVLYNIIYGDITISVKDRKSLTKRKKLVDFLLSKNKPISNKRTLFQRYIKFLLRIIKQARKYIVQNLQK